MFNKRSHGATMRFFLWAAFYANLCLFLICVIWKVNFLMFISITISLLIIITQKKHQVFINAIRLHAATSQNEKSFFQYLKYLFSKKRKAIGSVDTSEILSTSLQFSPNPDFSTGEAVLHSTTPVNVDEKKLKIQTGGSQCIKPYRGSVLGMDIPEFLLMNPDMFSGLDLASHAGKFSICIRDTDLEKCRDGNIILKCSLNKYSEFNDPDKLNDLMKRISSIDSVKGIEIVLFKMFDSFYTLSDFIDKKNNNHFSNSKELLQFIHELRSLTQGKPIGIRMGIRDKKEFIEFVRAMRETGILLDFITVLGEESTEQVSDQFDTIRYPHSAMPLDYAVPFVFTVLKAHKLKKEIKIWAAGKVDNGFDLLKLIALGADKCISIRSSKYFNQISDNYFFDDSGIVVKSNILFTYRKIIRETVQIMQHAGFSVPEEIDPKMFFKRINKSRIKSFDEIYFKSRSTSNWGIFEDFIHLN